MFKTHNLSLINTADTSSYEKYSAISQPYITPVLYTGTNIIPTGFKINPFLRKPFNINFVSAINFYLL